MISESSSLNGRSTSCGLHGLGADFDASSLLALLTEEGAHSTNLWMQQRCHSSSDPRSICMVPQVEAESSSMARVLKQVVTSSLTLWVCRNYY